MIVEVGGNHYLNRSKIDGLLCYSHASASASTSSVRPLANSLNRFFRCSAVR